MQMHDRRKTHLSKLLSLVLRHKPQEFNLTLEKGGWVRIDKLIEELSVKGTDMTRAELEQVIKGGEKQRFELNEDKSKVRATHGHSVQFEPDEQSAKTPPDVLFHGAVAKDIDDLKEVGLTSGDRMWVHLSPTRESAVQVAERRGTPLIVEIMAGEMAKEGHKFFFSASGLWLIREVPPKYMRFPTRSA
jgi:putative RNA 2'-phosphotransferase